MLSILSIIIFAAFTIPMSINVILINKSHRIKYYGEEEERMKKINRKRRRTTIILFMLLPVTWAIICFCNYLITK
jgi:sorbitol-specific phosphotransferase system component IIC